jgi:hypothetical protein
MLSELLTTSLNNLPIDNFFPQWLDSPSGPGPPHCRGFVIEIRHTTICKLLWMSDQLVAATSTWQLTALGERHLCPRRDSNTQFSKSNVVHFRLNNDVYLMLITFWQQQIKAEGHEHTIRGAVHRRPGTRTPAKVSSSTNSLTLKPFPIIHSLAVPTKTPFCYCLL